MNYKENKIDDLNLQLGITVEKADYEEKRKKKLNDFRRKADIKGFRKGYAPLSLVEKMYGGTALSESINEVVTDALNKYIDDNKLNILGEPLPSENSTENDWENSDSFTFDFDLGLAPKLEITVSAEDKITYYDATISAKAKDEYRSNLLKQYGKLVDTETIGSEDIFTANFEQGETKVENTYVALRSVAEGAKELFIGKKAGDVLDVDVNAAFENETDRAAMLKIEKSELASYDPVWKMTVVEVKTFVDAEPNQETFDLIFGAGEVKDEKEFEAKIKERIAAEYKQESDFRFKTDSREYFINKANIALPEAFLKRWIYEANEHKFTMEEIEKDFEPFLKDFRWQMIRNYILKEQNLKVEKEDLIAEAKVLAAYQFAMYGLNNVPEENLAQFAQNILQDEKQAQRIYEKVQDDKVTDYVKATVTIEKKKISIEKLRELNN